MTPYFSIIVPSYNQEAFLDKTLQSVFAQTFPDWECLIIDDGSTDSSAELAMRWAEKDERFKLYRKENGGLSSARNLGLAGASGKYIQFLDSDDILFPKKLEESRLKHEQNYDIVVSDYNILQDESIIDINRTVFQQSLSFKEILLAWDIHFAIPIHCGSFSRHLIGDTVFLESVKAGEDWIFWLSLFKKQPRALSIPEKLVLYRLHTQSMTRNPEHMIRNKHAAQLVIFEMLENDEEKKQFFARFSREVLEQRENCKKLQQKIDNRVSRKIRNSLRDFRKKIGIK